MEIIKYDIGGKTFFQRPLSNLQQTLVEEMIFESMGEGEISVHDAQTFFKALGAGRSRLMALVLIPEGLEIKQFVKQLDDAVFIEQQVEWFDFQASPGDRYKVINDFFACNQIGSCIESLTSLISWVQEKMKAANDVLPDAGLKNSVLLSPEATPQTVNMSTV